MTPYITFASDFGFVLNWFKFVLLTPFFGVGIALGFLLGQKLASGRNEIITTISFLVCVLGTAASFTWLGNSFINLCVR